MFEQNLKLKIIQKKKKILTENFKHMVSILLKTKYKTRERYKFKHKSA